MKLSVIIPALNEGKYIKACIESVRRLNPFEIIVVDGGSTDRTKEIAQRAGAIVIESPTGRGIQMNTGASFAKGDMLMFLHADSQLSLRAERSNLDFLKEIATRPSGARNEGLLNKNYIGGFFRLKFDDNSLSTRLVEIFANLRARLFSLPYGDQALFVKREVFDSIGGFKNYPFLEDLDMILRLRKAGKLISLPFEAIASSRRINKGYPLSPVLISLRNVFIALLFLVGVSPFSLLRLYK